MVEGRVKVVNRLGLHARAAAQLVRVAGSFGSRIILTRTDKDASANAKSILSVLALAAACGAELHISVDGEDETQALKDIQALFASRFGESA